MTVELYLIAHKVRGEPAFDIAQHLTCMVCEGTNDHCHECDGQGHWWIIPTSGHRAWPYWDVAFSDLNSVGLMTNFAEIVGQALPSSLRDHYTTEREAALDLTKALGLTPAPRAPILRRL